MRAPAALLHYRLAPFHRSRCPEDMSLFGAMRCVSETRQKVGHSCQSSTHFNRTRAGSHMSGPARRMRDYGKPLPARVSEPWQVCTLQRWLIFPTTLLEMATRRQAASARQQSKGAPGASTEKGCKSTEPFWRGKPPIQDGDLDKGRTHIKARHIDGTHPNGAGDLFPPGTSRLCPPDRSGPGCSEFPEPT